MKCLSQFFCVIAFCCTVLCCTNNSSNNSEEPSAIIAKAGNITVTTQDLSEALVKMPGPQQFEYLSDKGRYVLLDMLIDWKLLSREAVKAGLDRDSDIKGDLKRATTAYERDQVLGSAYLRSRIEGLTPVSEEHIQDVYNDSSDVFSLPERRKVHRILFVTDERAREALPQLKAGMDFQQYKEQHSEEKIKVSTIWMQATKDQDVSAQIILSLGAGETSDIVALKSGFCIMRVLSVVPAKALTLEEVRETIRLQLRNRNEYELIGRIKQSLRQGLEIDLNTNLLESYDCGECAGRQTDHDVTTQAD